MAAAWPRHEAEKTPKVTYFNKSEKYGSKTGVPCAFTIREDDLNYYDAPTINKDTGAPLSSQSRILALGGAIDGLLDGKGPFIYVRASSTNANAFTVCIYRGHPRIDRMTRVAINEDGEWHMTGDRLSPIPLTLKAIVAGSKDREVFPSLLVRVVASELAVGRIPAEVAAMFDTTSKVLEHLVVPGDPERAYSVRVGDGLVPINLGADGKFRFPTRALTDSEQTRFYRGGFSAKVIVDEVYADFEACPAPSARASDGTAVPSGAVADDSGFIDASAAAPASDGTGPYGADVATKATAMGLTPEQVATLFAAFGKHARSEPGSAAEPHS